MYAKLKINDFKSIKKIDNIKLYSNKLNYFIGENNSGKSNILDTIISLNSEMNYIPHIDISNCDINESDLNPSVRLSISYEDNEKIEIKKILKKLDIQKTDFEYCYFFNLKTNFSSIWEIFKNNLKNGYWESYLKFKKVTSLYDLFLNRNNFEKDSKSTAQVIRDNSKLQKELLLLESLLKITEKKIYIFGSENSFNLKNSYDLRDINKSQQDPSYNNETMNFINFLIKDTKIKMDDVKEYVFTDDTDKISSLNKKMKNEINKKINNIFNSYFGDELNSEIKILLNQQSLRLEIDSKKKFNYNSVEKEKASDGLKQVIYSLFSFEKMKSLFNDSKNDLFFFLIDEPEKNLNPLIQEKYIAALNKNVNDVFANSNVYVVLTTHSLNVIPQIDIKNVPSHFNFVEREPILETHIVKDDFNRISNANQYLVKKRNRINE